LLGGVPLDPRSSRILVPPAGIAVRASSGHAPTDDPRNMRARHYIRQYGCRNIKSFQVADFVGVSRTSLETLFRREFDCSVHDEILRFRLEAATAGKCSIADVALQCGFTTSQYMHAVFKRELGCTPKGYQERLRAAEEDGQEVLAQA
jgi:LacI family transcriptional regulator